MSPTARALSVLVGSTLVQALWNAPVHARPVHQTSGRYENAKFGFSCVGPGDGWSFSEEESGAKWSTPDGSAGMVARHLMVINQEVTSQYIDRLFANFDDNTGFERVESSRGMLNGHPAYFATRRQGNILMRDTIVIVGQNAYALGMAGSPTDLSEYAHLYERLVDSFQIRVDEISSAVQEPSRPPTTRRISAPALPHLFRGRGLGYTINYPSGWDAERIDENTVRIQGGDGGAIEALILTRRNSGGDETPDGLMEVLKAEISNDHPKVQFTPVKDLKLAGGLLNGRQSVAEFYEGWVHVRQWQGVLRKQDGTTIAMFVRGPYESMDAHVQTINKLIDSLSPTR